MINGFINGNAVYGLCHKSDELRSQVDRDGDGKLSYQERASLREDLKNKAVLVADSDGDGTVSRAEREALREAIQQRHEVTRDEHQAVTLSARLRALLRNSTPSNADQQLIAQADPPTRPQSSASDQLGANDDPAVKVDVKA